VGDKKKGRAGRGGRKSQEKKTHFRKNCRREGTQGGKGEEPERAQMGGKCKMSQGMTGGQKQNFPISR